MLLALSYKVLVQSLLIKFLRRCSAIGDVVTAAIYRNITLYVHTNNMPMSMSYVCICIISGYHQ